MLKRALVLAGGGSKGSFEIGVMKYLLEDNKNQYDIITGISVGALNASLFSQFPIGKESEALLALETIWDNIEESTVYVNHKPFGKLQALWKPSVYDSSPLRKFLIKNLDPKKVKSSGRELRISACSLVTGTVKTWTEQDESDIIDAVLASASFPVMLCPIEINGDLFTDAGVKEIAPLNSAIKAGADIIDVIITSPIESQIWKQNNKRKPNTIKVLMRCIELMTDEILVNDLVRIDNINKQIKEGTANSKYRNIEINLYQPDKVLIDNCLKFDRKTMSEMKTLGYKAGKTYDNNAASKNK